MLRVIRKGMENSIAGILSKGKRFASSELTKNYVLRDSSLACLKHNSIEVSAIFNDYLYTGNEYCIRYNDFYLVNGSLMQLTLSKEIKDTYVINICSKEDFRVLKSCTVNKYLLYSLSILYGYGVKNSIYLAAFSWIYKRQCEPDEINSFLVIRTDGKDIEYVTYSEIYYKDGSLERYKGEQVIDSLSFTPFNNKIELGKYYCKDLLSGSNKYIILNGSSPF